jgi:hypothetical protein
LYVGDAFSSYPIRQERRQAVKRTRKAEKCMRRKAAKGAKNPSGTGEIVTESWETPVYLGDHPLQIEELKARAIWEAMGKKDVPDDAIIRCVCLANPAQAIRVRARVCVDMH